MLNIPKGKKFNREEIYKLCFNRYMYKTMFNGCYPGNPESFKNIEEKRRRKANIYAVQNTENYYNHQDQIKDW